MALKPKLLIVDDEKDICHFIKLLFIKKGFQVYSALAGRQAIALAKKIKPQISLIDLYLKKGIDGLEVLKQIRKSVSSCRNIMVTWDKSADKVKQARKLGAVSYLVKPLTVNQLLKAVNRVLAGARKRG